MNAIELENEVIPTSKLPSDHPLYLDPAHMKLFLKYIKINSLDEDTCWTWNGAVDKETGYGKFRIGDKIFWAHRIALYNREGAPSNPERKIVRHRCPCKDNLCLRHIKFGTYRDNYVDSILDGTVSRLPKDVSKIFYSDPSENEKLIPVWKNYELKK